MSIITIQCRLVADESSRHQLWELMAEKNTPLINELLEQIGHHPDFETWRDKGKLPADVVEPKFVADLNHRRKGLTGELIKLDKSKVHERATMTRMDSTRIGKNFAYMVRTLRDRPLHEYEDAAKAVLDHHFDCHEYCGDWCKRTHAGYFVELLEF